MKRKRKSPKRGLPDPVPEVIEWLDGLERRAGEGKCGVPWIEAALRGGPDPGSVQLGGFCRPSAGRKDMPNA